MASANEIIFLMVSLIILGMTVHAASLYGGATEARPSRALMATFVLANLAGLTAMSYAWLAPFFLSMANTLVLASLTASALTVRSWRMPLTSRWVAGAALALLLVLAVFEYMRQNSGYVERVIFFSTLSTVMLSWVIWEAWQVSRREKVFQLKFLMVVAFTGMTMRLARMVVVLQQTTHPQSLFEESGWAMVLRLTAMSTDVLMLSSLLAFSTYLLAARHQAEKKDNERVRQANQALDAALAEKNQMIKALALSAKSNNMGVLLGSLVHELTQPLQTMQLRTELLVTDTALDSEGRQKLLQGVLQDNQRAMAIMDQLRKFLRNGAIEFSAVCLSDVVSDALAIVKPALQRHQVDLQEQTAPALFTWGDEGQLQMVILNLLKNARDALHNAPQPRTLALQLQQNEQFLELTVSDNGPGVDPAQWDLIFEMFHSTKPDGMGLGLWLSQAIIQNHGGSLTVGDSPLGGACFTLRLPIHSVSA
ncbi:MAG: HAMP domain-containing histidine kinase [Limnohabitans sp.]|nr:HAMP domain-containing histidine kinase [Limnohabitans sp.]